MVKKVMYGHIREREDFGEIKFLVGSSEMFVVGNSHMQGFKVLKWRTWAQGRSQDLNIGGTESKRYNLVYRKK
jgi:hypothetical protein